MTEINFTTKPIENPLGLCESCGKPKDNTEFFLIKYNVCKKCRRELLEISTIGIFLIIGLIGIALFILK